MNRLSKPNSRKPSQGERTGRGERAQGMVEFALVLPLLLLLFFGIIELGRLMVIYTSVAAASREGARFGSAAGTSDNGVPYYMDTAGIQAAISRMTVLVAPDSVDITYDHGPGTSEFTPASSHDVQLRDRINVTVVAQYDPILGLTPLQPFEISSTTSRTIVKEVAIVPGTGGGGGGTNNPPVVTITFPATFPSPYVVQQGTTINFAATATDTEDGDLTASIEWISSVDGDLSCSGGSCPLSNLSPGSHVITARVTDSDGNIDTDTRLVFIDPPPTIGIWTPHDGERFEQGAPITFLAFASEMFEGPLNDRIQWYDNGVLLASNVQTFTRTDLAAGLHTIRAEVTDSGGQTASISISIVITPRTPPTLTILTPVDDSFYARGSRIVFTGVASDAEDGDLSASIRWTSSLNGLIGTGASVSTAGLSIGTHTITATVTDSDGMTTTATITIRVVDDRPPLVDITSPANGTYVDQGTLLTYTAVAVDATDGNLSSQIIWRSSISGQIGTGASFNLSTLPPGIHTIIASVTDSDGLTGSDSIVVTIVEHNDPPTIRIDAPANNAALNSHVPINFRGTATDPQDGVISDWIRWASSINGNLGTGASITTTLSVGTHAITATVTDLGGVSASASIRVTVWAQVCPSPGITVWSYQNTNFANSVSWFPTIPSGTTQTMPYVLDYLRIVLYNTSADISSITVEGVPVPASQIVHNGSIVEVFGPIWTGYFRAANNIEIIYSFSPRPRANQDGPMTLVATFQGCSSIQSSAGP